MQLVIHDEPLVVRLFGASLLHDPAMSFGAEIRVLLDRVWHVIRSRTLMHKGINWVLYDADGRVFAGVELGTDAPGGSGLELRDVRLGRYAVWKHVGPVERIGDAYEGMKRAIVSTGLTKGYPLIEKYGHWTGDAATFEIDLMCPLL